MSTQTDEKPGKWESLGNILLRLVFRTILYLPWIWFAVMAIYVVLAAVQVGHLPRYGQPDPKDVPLGGILYMPAIILMFMTLGSTPFGIALAVARLWQDVPQFIRTSEVYAYLVGIALFFLFVVSDFAGLMTWLAD
jgi:hypothetical protein